MSFRLIDHGWDKELDAALLKDSNSVRVIAPFIKQRAAERLLRRGCPETIEVITRFHLGDFSDGVSDIGALRLLLSQGAKIRGVKNLHSKLYLFGESQVIVTSANLTEAALTRNYEFGFTAGEPAIVSGWPNYIRVHHGEFLAGSLSGGVRLSELMDTFNADSFASTQRNARQGSGNRDPRQAYKQAPAVELTPEAMNWLNERLEEAFAKHGRLSDAELDALDWPALPTMHLEAFQEWLEAGQGLKSNTAREYVYFLKRCMAHYGVDINTKTVPNENVADVMLAQVSRVVEERGRWTDGTFDERDVRQNLRPALRAFGRFSQSRKPS